MVLQFPLKPGSGRNAERSTLEVLLCQLHEAADDEDLQAAVDRIAAGERDALRTALQKVCGLLGPDRQGARDRVYIPY
ncbi:hypothetical protein HLB44_34595 [Aquincola sp. S2]|uniref:Uncharacterized protein n=1 Tax=Pseudaquabacterium terrae TaxID=2732868 RepID=A0ABX2EU15_9BURK|nr:hypothetical protein [Aquabacterium terrae]NRF72126.1 hypothetical protein [Aquabacterium terrae]